MKSKAFRSAFPHTLPVMAGYLFLGMGFGILLESNGYSFIWAFFMSIFIYAGSMQYVAIDLLASGASLISTAIMTLMIQVRHLFYGLSIIDKYKDTGKKKLLLIHLFSGCYNPGSGRCGQGMVLFVYLHAGSRLLDHRLHVRCTLWFPGQLQYKRCGFCHDSTVYCNLY